MVAKPRERPLLIEDLAWPAVAALVEQGERLCLLPVGATEQHGRHLPLATDSTIATAICHQTSILTGVPVLPTLQMTSSNAHTPKWPGTLSLAPRLFIEMLVQLSVWIAAAGFTKLLILNVHGGNAGPIKVAVDEIRCAGGLQVGAINYYELSEDIKRRILADGEDVHANAAETSLMLHLREDLVLMNEVRDDPDRTIGRVFSYTVAQTSIDGLTGRPSEASREAGAALFDLIVTTLAAKVELAKHEVPPDL